MLENQNLNLVMAFKLFVPRLVKLFLLLLFLWGFFVFCGVFCEEKVRASFFEVLQRSQKKMEALVFYVLWLRRKVLDMVTCGEYFTSPQVGIQMRQSIQEWTQ